MSTPRPRSTTVHLVRHGLTPTTGIELPGRRRGLNLSDKGLAQAESTAVFLASKQIAAVYSSPLERAVQTAKEIAFECSLRVRLAAEVLEGDIGTWTGRKISAVSKTRDWQRMLEAPSQFRFPDGESFIEIQNRVVEGIYEIVERHKYKKIVIVSHADPIKLFLNHVVGASLDLFDRFYIEPASVSTVVFGKVPYIERVNYRPNGNGK